MTTRHDIPTPVRKLFTVALECNLIDAFDIFEYGNRFHADMDEGFQSWAEVVDDLTRVAFVARHSAKGLENHARICQAADECCAELEAA